MLFLVVFSSPSRPFDRFKLSYILYEYINNIIIIYLGRWWFFSLPRAPPALSHVGPRVATSWYRGSVPAGHVLCIVVFIYAYSIYLRHAWCMCVWYEDVSIYAYHTLVHTHIYIYYILCIRLATRILVHLHTKSILKSLIRVSLRSSRRYIL